MEYITLSEDVKKVMFVAQLLGSMQIVVQYPVMVRVDNVSAIFMARNIMTMIQNMWTFSISMLMSMWKMGLLRYFC